MKVLLAATVNSLLDRKRKNNGTLETRIRNMVEKFNWKTSNE